MSDKPPNDEASPRGPGSFCVPRAAIEALLDAKANVYEICAYLVLARFTDESGRYSTASVAAINRYTGSNKLKDGPVHRAIERLKAIRAKRMEKVSNGRSGRNHAWVEQATDLGPILFTRDAWHEQTGEVLPDGPHERATVKFVLPDFGEDHNERVWFGGNLVTGVGGFNHPLKALRNAGDVAARLLLSMYAANDMETWGGVRPVGRNHGPCKRYEPVIDDAHLHGGARLVRAKDQGHVAQISEHISGGNNDTATEAYWDALRALESSGLIYEVVMVLNRNAVKAKFGRTGEEYGAIPDDAEPYYTLDTRSAHGYKPEGEEGIGGVTARTAGDLHHPVAVEGGRFDGTYAAIVPRGYPAMVAGIYRLRFRVANPKNAGVRGAWARIRQNDREAFELVQNIRAANRLEPLSSPLAPRKESAPS